MARRQREWAKRARLALIHALGGKCTACGRDDCLTIDHINGRDWDIRAVGSAWRISIYRWEAANGRVRVLCATCNNEPRRRYGRRRASLPEGYVE